MDLEITIVTADAMNCQKGTVKAIGFFDEECLEGIKWKEYGYKKTIEPEHGGSAAREYYITEDTGWYREKRMEKPVQFLNGA